MRRMVILTVCALLAGCDAVKERIDERLDILRTNEQREAIDSAKCQGYGAQPGTDIYIQCMVAMAQVRATNGASAAAARAANRNTFLNTGANQASGLPPLPAFQSGPATCAQNGPVFHTC